MMQSTYSHCASSMSEIAGNYAIIMAARYLANTDNGKGVLMGGISGVPPAKVLIIGAGVVGEFAARGCIWPGRFCNDI